MLEKSLPSVAMIGAGTMGCAMARNLAREGYRVHATRPDPENAAYLAEFGIKINEDNRKAVSDSDIVIFAVKPHLVIPVVEGVSDLAEGKLFLSIAAGLELALYNSVFPNIKWVRFMTNTCIAIQKGFIFYTPNSLVSEKECETVNFLFETMGAAEQVDESLMNPLTAIVGSGPAYIYTVAEALTLGGIKAGIPKDLASKAALNMIRGAAEMVLESGLHTSELRDQVLTPGGTTIAGVYELESAGVRTAFMDAVLAASERGSDLSRIAGEKLKQQLEEEEN
jgi:pyrroline-5-carboxylate reductase